MKATAQGSRTQQNGVAAIEFVVIFPILFLLLIYTVNAVQYVSQLRRLELTAYLVADVVSRRDSPTTAVQVDDAFEAAKKQILPRSSTDLKIDVYNYYKPTAPGQPITLRWKRSFPQSAITGCTPAPDVAANGRYDGMIGTGDLLIVIACLPFVPVLSAYGTDWMVTMLPSPRQELSARPRRTTILDCDNNCT